MTDDNEVERQRLMQKPTPAKPKSAPAQMFEAMAKDQGQPAARELDQFMPKPVPHHDPFADFAQIVKLLRRHDRGMRLQILELVTELID